MSYCKICKIYMYSHEKHSCPPHWEYGCEDTIGDKTTVEWIGDVYDYDEESAATLAAENLDCSSGDYTLANGGEIIIIIKPYGSDDKAYSRFSCTAEIVAQYHASKLEDSTESLETEGDT